MSTERGGNLTNNENAMNSNNYENSPKNEKTYSGHLTLRVPKQLHRKLVEEAKRNGVSLNQYALYKLSRGVGLQDVELE